MACCFLQATITGAEDEEREGKQFVLSPFAVNYPFYYDVGNYPFNVNADGAAAAKEGASKSSFLEARVPNTKYLLGQWKFQNKMMSTQMSR